MPDRWSVQKTRHAKAEARAAASHSRATLRTVRRVAGGAALGLVLPLAATARANSADPARRPVACLLVASAPKPEVLPVFPGAEGFGTTTPAGRGGTIIRVTNLDDSGPGSLRAALAATGPRVVIFDVAGTIRLSDKLIISSPFLTVAGQTAPSPGVTLRGGGLSIRTHDVLVQHIRIRPGDDATGAKPANRDALEILHPAYNVVIDHVSASWAVDENASTWYPVRDVTISNTIISEGLSRSLHPEGEHSKGFLLGRDGLRVAFLKNLLAHSRDRNILQQGNTSAYVANNVFFNWGKENATKWQDNVGTGKPTLGTYVGNVYRAGLSTPARHLPIDISSNVAAGTKLYLADNVWYGRSISNQWSMVENDAGGRVVATSPPVTITSYQPLAGSETMQHVLSRAGARPADRDAVDKRVTSEVMSGAGRIIDSPSQVGGWTSLPMVSQPLAVPGDPSSDSDSDGYTNLEEWLHQLAAAVGG